MASFPPLWRAHARPAALALVVVLALLATGCGDRNADIDRGRQLFIAEVRHLPHARPGGHHRRHRARTSTPPSRPPARRGTDHDTIEGVVKAQIESPRPVDPDVNPGIYMPPTSSRARTPRTSPPTSPASPASPASSRRPCPARPVPRSSPSRLRRLPHARRGGHRGDVGPNLDKFSPEDPAKSSKSRSPIPGGDRQGLSAQRDAADLSSAPIQPDDLKALVDYLATCTGKSAPKSCSG